MLREARRECWEEIRNKKTPDDGLVLGQNHFLNVTPRHADGVSSGEVFSWPANTAALTPALKLTVVHAQVNVRGNSRQVPGKILQIRYSTV